jgi:hypothetical protein
VIGFSFRIVGISTGVELFYFVRRESFSSKVAKMGKSGQKRRKWAKVAKMGKSGENGQKWETTENPQKRYLASAMWPAAGGHVRALVASVTS